MKKVCTSIAAFRRSILTGSIATLAAVSAQRAHATDLIVNGGQLHLTSHLEFAGGTYIRNGGTLFADVANVFPVSSGRTAMALDDIGSGGSVLVLNVGNQSVASLTGMASSGVNLNANTLSIGFGTGVNTIGTPNANFAGIISGSGGLVKDQGSTQILSGANTYTGATTVNAGTLQIGNGSSGSISGVSQVLVNFGANLNISLANFGTFASDVANYGSVNAVGSTTYFITGQITGSGSFNQNGGGTTVLAGGAHTYTGATNVYAGTLQIGDGSFGSINAASQVTVSLGANLNISLANGGIFASGVENSGSVNAVGSTTYFIAGPISGSGSFNQNGGGTTVLAGANTYTGATNVNAGTLQIGTPDGFGGAINAASQVNVSLGANLNISLANGVFANSVLNNGSVNAVGSTNYIIAGLILGSGRFEHNGGGTTLLAGANTYTGATNVNAGILQIGDGLGGSINGASQVSVSSGAGLLLSLANGGVFANSVTNNGGFEAIGTTTNRITGSITGSGGFNQNGAGGTTILSGANTYTAATNVYAGTLQIGDGSFGSINGASQVSVSSGAALELSLGNNGVFANSVLNNGSVNAIGSANNTITGSITGSGSFTQYGSGGMTTLSGTNTYSGGTTIFAGTLQIGNGGSTGSIAGNVVDNGILIFNRSDALTFGGILSGPGSLTKLAAGTLTLSGANTYGGGTAINGGTLSLGSSGALGTAGTISFGGGTLQYSASNTTDYSPRFSTAASQAYAVDTNGQNVTLATALTSSGGTLVKSGAGTLTLSGANTYTGTTTITSGALTASVAGALGSSSSTAVAGTLNLTAGAVTYTGLTTVSGAGVINVTLGTGFNSTLLDGNYSAFTGTLNIGIGAAASAGKVRMNGADNAAATVNLLANGTLYLVGATKNASIVLNGGNTGESLGQLRLDGGTTWTGSVTLAGDITGAGDFTVGSFSGTSTISGAIGETGGSRALSKGGTGTIILSAANTYTGGTTVSQGTLQIGNGGTTGSVIGNITDNAALIFNRSNAATHSGVISGTGTLTKNGAGALTLSNTNTYAGATTVNLGALNVTGNITGSAVTVTGGTLAGGTGASTTIGNTGAITLNGGAVAPGDSTVTNGTGILTANGNFSMAAGTSLNMTLNGTTLGTAYDRLKVLGTVILNGGASAATSLANLALGGTLGSVAAGTLFFLLDNDGVDAISGFFAGLAQGVTIPTALNGQRYDISYTGDVGTNAFAGAGNDIVVRAIATSSYATFSTTTFPGIGAESEDYDRDGLSNFAEYMLGTDPTVKNSATIAHNFPAGKNQLVFPRPGNSNARFPGEAGIVYKVQASADMAVWTTNQVTIPSSTGANQGPITVGNFTYSIVVSGSGPTLTESVTVTDNTAATQRFIRLLMSKP